MKLLSGAYSTLEQMDDGTDKSQFEKEIDEYKNEVFVNGGLTHKHDKGWDASEEYGCGVRFDTEGKSFLHYSCVLGRCNECTKNEYKAPKFESNFDNEEIFYTRFTTHVRCNIHDFFP